MSYFKFEEDDARRYVEDFKFFPVGSNLEVEEIGTGNMNYVYRIWDADKGNSVILKQAVPYARCIGESYPMSLERIIVEANALKFQNKYASGTVPEFYHLDEAMALMLMEDMSSYDVMRQGMINMKKYPSFPEQLSTFLANMAFYTSNLYLDSEEKRELTSKFTNSNLIKITEVVIFTDPFFEEGYNRVNPEIEEYLKNVFWKNEEIKLEVSKLKYKFCTEAQSLVHGDLHTGSIFANEDSIKVFDSEFSFYGPSAFDLGLFTAHMFLNYFSWSGKDYGKNEIQDYRNYITDSVEELYKLYFEKFNKLWNENEINISAKVNGYQEFYFRNLFVDAVGYAAVVMIRRIHGLSHVEDIDDITDIEKRKLVQIKVLEFAQKMLLKREKYRKISELLDDIKSSI